MTALCELAIKHGTDKHLFHEYTPVYYDLLKDKSVHRVLEIGVCEGASLRMWREFFPDAMIVGIDIDQKYMISAEPRIITFCCDQADVSSLRAICGEDMFDLMIDDGSHMLMHQIISMQTLLPFLAPDGIYVIEDVGAYRQSTALDQLILAMPPGFVYSVPQCPPSKCPDEKLLVIRHG